MKTKRIIAAVLAISMMAAVSASAAEEPKQNIVIQTEINGQGVATHYDGEDLVTDTYKAEVGEPIEIGTEEPSETETAIEKDDEMPQEVKEAIFKTPFFQMIREFVFKTIDEYYKLHADKEVSK